MVSTKIIATLGPSSYNDDVLTHFKNNNVQIIRQNMSHNYVDWHLEASNKIKEFGGFDILLDSPGPKVRLGEVKNVVEIKTGEIILIEMQKEGVDYPYLSEEGYQVFPNQFPAHEFVKKGHPILIDDGKMEVIVLEVLPPDRIKCEVKFGGPFKSRKGMNMPVTEVDVDFLTLRDIEFLTGLLAKVRPKYVAVSFVKTVEDIKEIKGLVSEILKAAGIADYFPLICAKLEMSKALEDGNLAEIVQEADLIMIARGDLALETLPAHLAVPFLQEKIIKFCNEADKPFVVATQMLESMIENAVPTRAEISDLYRAIYTNNANFIMCSGETAMGQFPKNTVSMMSDMIKYCKDQKKNEAYSLMFNN